MFDDLTWGAILKAWPWFGAAVTVFFIAVGLLIAFKPKPKSETAADDADNVAWTLTGRIDLADPQLADAFVLQVEESRISTSPTGVEHREIRWRRATLPEDKMVLESSHAQQNLAMSGTTAIVPTGTQQKVNAQADSVETELKELGHRQDMADVTLVPQDPKR